MSIPVTALQTIDSTETINDIVVRFPHVWPVLQQFGIDTCCGGSLPLATVAEHHQIEYTTLLTALHNAIEAGS